MLLGGVSPKAGTPLVYYNCENWLRRDHILPDAIEMHFKAVLYQMYATLADGGGGASPKAGTPSLYGHCEICMRGDHVLPNVMKMHVETLPDVCYLGE